MREAAGNLEFEEAARLRDEIKRLQDTELLIADDPFARQEALPSASTGSDKKRAKPKARSSQGKPGTRTFKKKGRR